MSDSSPPPEPAVPQPDPSAADPGRPRADGAVSPALPPAPRVAEPGPSRSGPSRRWFLAGGAAVLVGAGAGVAVEVLGRTEPAEPAGPPAALIAAVHAERALIADLDATTGGSPRVRGLIKQARADHAAHLSALRGVLAGYPGARTAARRPPGRPRTVVQLHAAERDAAQTAARHGAALSGAAAALLASIAACEASHAELLR